MIVYLILFTKSIWFLIPNMIQYQKSICFIFAFGIAILNSIIYTYIYPLIVPDFRTFQGKKVVAFAGIVFSFCKCLLTWVRWKRKIIILSFWGAKVTKNLLKIPHCVRNDILHFIIVRIFFSYIELTFINFLKLYFFLIIALSDIPFLAPRYIFPFYGFLSCISIFLLCV